LQIVNEGSQWINTEVEDIKLNFSQTKRPAHKANLRERLLMAAEKI